MRHSGYSKQLKGLMMAALAAVGLGSCSMMTDDLKPCPDGLYVKFTYDYNTQRADLFPYHVGHIRLLVFDESGAKVAERAVSNTDTAQPLAQHGYTVYFPTSELPPGKYRLQAIGMQRDWDEALSTEGAKYRRQEALHINDHHITLDHFAPEIPFDDGNHQVEDRAPLDTLWHTLKVTSTLPLDKRDDPGVHRTTKPYSIYPVADQMVTVEENKYTYATVSLIRDTKHLNLTLRQIDNPAECRHQDYEVYITDDNTHLDANNEIVPEQAVRYTPYAQWTTKFSDNGLEIDGEVETKAGVDGDATVKERVAHYGLMFNRLMYPEKAGDGAVLKIRNRSTGKDIATVNLPHVLSDGRIAYEIYNYGAQEYLDREHDYSLDFILKGDQWLYLEIHVLSWSKRTQNLDLQ